MGCNWPVRSDFLVDATDVAAADAWIEQWKAEHPGGTVVRAPEPIDWPFRHPLVPELPTGAVVVRVDGIDDAFPDHQTNSTRLVTTQRVYLEAEWSAALEKHGAAFLVMTPGSFFDPTEAKNEPGVLGALPCAFRLSDPIERLKQCVEALGAGRTAAALVATASACMEVNDFDAAARDLDEAIALAPEWPAAHFERGKLWLRVDDMVKASESFQMAATRLPRFAPAWANLGGTLGELDRPAEALAAFEHALAADPDNPQALNNVGVVRRELGRLNESEAAFREVIRRLPGLAFGHYNLGHTLFLQGRFQAALSAYAEGQARDAEKNPVQASRLALCKVATGDGAGALRELQGAVSALPGEYRCQLLADTSAILWALVTQHPELTAWQPVQAWLAEELRVKS
jgi:tetratricopeptide (TPR) repeat protein